MAKVKNPLHSLSASGKIRDTVRYMRSRGQNKAISRRSPEAALGLRQRRQATIIAEGARLWRTRNGKGPEKTYLKYVAGISRNSWLFYSDAILMEWSYNQLLVVD